MQRFLIIILVFLMFSCTKDETASINSSGNSNINKWLVPEEKLVLTENAHDDIPSIDHPQFKHWENTTIANKEMVIVFLEEDIVKVYPKNILSAHEIVNDSIKNLYYCVTYCPLTATAIAWDRSYNEEVLEFGVSGHLYNENLIPYDRKTESYWSQILLQSIKGPMSSNRLNSLPLLSLEAGLARQEFPKALVLYSDYHCDSICQTKADNSININTEKYGIVNPGFGPKQTKALYEYTRFETPLIEIQNVGNENFLFVGNNSPYFRAAFKSNNIDGFQWISSEFPIRFSDHRGNIYDLSGEVIEGPDLGLQLEWAPAFSARPFVWEEFFE